MAVIAAIYLRQSLDREGDQLAISRQREDCEQIAAQRGWHVVSTYVDNSVSASKRNVRRPEYDQMVADFAAGKFEALICWDLDRLTRQPRQLEDWIDAAEGRGLKLVTANGEADLTTDAGRMFARIKAAVARQEVERKSVRQTRAAQQRADRGRVPAGVRLTGYETDGSVIPSEADLVRRVFEMFAAGETLKGLAAWLEESAVRTRTGRAWSSSTIRTMLTNPRYAGRAVYRGAATGKHGAWEPIVGEGVFDAVQARLNDPRRVTNREGTERKYLGSGLYRCGVCRGRLRTNGARYWCPAGGHVTRGQAPIDALVEAVMRSRLEQPDTAQMLAPPDNAALASADAESHELRARLAAIEADYDSGLIDGKRYAVAVEKVQANLQRVESERARALLGGAAGPLLSARKPAEAFAGASLGAKRALIDALLTVTVMPSQQGRKGFDPESVRFEWKHSKEVPAT